MLMDERTELADAFPVSTAGTGRAVAGDVIDTGGAHGNTGNGLYLVVQVAQAFTSGGAATVSFELVSDAQGALATDGTATQHFATGAIPVAQLVAGCVAMAVRMPGGDYERYVGILQNVGTAALTGGKVNIFLTPDASRWRAYADNVA